MKRHATERAHAVGHLAPPSAGVVTHTAPPRPLDFLTVATGPSHVVVVDHAGARSYGALWSHHPDRLRDFDVYLDSLDAANEDADGRLAA